MKTITLLPGDGIGPELTGAAVHVRDAVPGSAPGVAGRYVASPPAPNQPEVLRVREAERA